MYNLDEDESQGGIAINLLPLMAQDVLHKADSRITAGQKNGRSENAHAFKLTPKQADLKQTLAQCYTSIVFIK